MMLRLSADDRRQGAGKGNARGVFRFGMTILRSGESLLQGQASEQARVADLLNMVVDNGCYL